MEKNALLSPIVLGGIELKNRIWMAPLTRVRAETKVITQQNPDGTAIQLEDRHIPGDMMLEYYCQRASSGLIIAEATIAMAGGFSTFYTEPGIYSAEQVAGWRRITDAVHAKGGHIFLQIYHGGRASTPLNNNGQPGVAPSPIPITSNGVRPFFNPTGQPIDHQMPRALELEEIPRIVEGFAKATQNALGPAGFDGVEIHAANGYLIDQFLRSSANQRTDKYGGSLENRARLLLEIVDVCIAAADGDSKKIGVRLSPLNSFQSMKDDDPVGLTKYVCSALNERRVGFVHLMRGDFFKQQEGDVITPAREHFKEGVLVVNMWYTPEEAEEAVRSGKLDAVAFGSMYVSNPDLVERIAQKAPLNAPNVDLYYTRGPEGYLDYPTLAATSSE